MRQSEFQSHVELIYGMQVSRVFQDFLRLQMAATTLMSSSLPVRQF